MRVCWEVGPADARTLHEASLAEASPFRRFVGKWQLLTFRATLDKIVKKGYLRVEPSTDVAITAKGQDKWAVTDYLETEVKVDRATAAAQLATCSAARPYVPYRTTERKAGERIKKELERRGA